MGYEPTVFNQLFNFIPRHTFQKSADRLDADRYAKSFKAWQQFLLLLYAQATGKQTLREITGGLQVHSPRLYQRPRIETGVPWDAGASTKLDIRRYHEQPTPEQFAVHVKAG